MLRDDLVKYEPEGDQYIPPERWGRDHFQTLLYLETRAVDEKGIIDNRQMRCNPRLHRQFANIGYSGIIDGSKYPTRLKEGEITNHDDWSCLDDLVKAGCVEAYYWDDKPDELFGNFKALVVFTPLGLTMAASLRAHKANGGKLSEFQLEVHNEYTP